MTLVPVSVLLGAFTMWAFRRTANPQAIRQTINHIQARLLEFWLYVDEPSLMWKSWKGLITANLRFLRLLVLPLLILAVPLTPIYFFLDAVYGSSQLMVGQPALVTLAINQPLDRLSDAPVLEAPDGLSIESPPVHVFSERQVSWRIRPLRPLSGELQWLIAGGRVRKSVSAGPGGGVHLVSRRRTQSLVELVRYPTETPLGAGPVEWIEVSYPDAAVALLGIEAHWSVWFFAFSLLGAVLSPKFR